MECGCAWLWCGRTLSGLRLHTKGSLRTVDRAAAQAIAEEVLQKAELTMLQRFVIYV